MKRIVILLVACLAFAASAFSQSKPFSTEKDAFFEELNAYLTSSQDDKAEAMALMNEFRGVWSNHYDAAEATLAMELYELMRKKTGNRAYYNIFTFTEILLRAPYNGMTKNDMNRFLVYSGRRFAKRHTQMDKYLTSCRDLFVDHVMEARGATQWVAPNASFTFPTDTACIFEVKQCDLILKSDNDQSVIRGTHGLFNLETHQWKGHGGRVDWNRFGIPRDMVYAVVNDYQISFSTTSYTIDEVDFYNKYYFNHPCRCTFEDAVSNTVPNEKTMFPKATSKGDQVEHGQLFGNVDFLAGFGMAGRSVSFFGSDGLPAQFVFKFRNRPTVKVMSKRFLLSDNTLVSNSTSARIYLHDTVVHSIDSIYHNDLGFQYSDTKKQVLLYRKDNGVGTGPFHDTYHGYDIFLEAVYWDLAKDFMEFRRLGGTSGESEGMVASVSYFRKSDYLKLQALDQRHPMESLNRFMKMYGDDNRRFHIDDFVAYLKYPSSQVLSLILTLQSEGYLEYDKDTHLVTVLDRFYDVLASEHNEFDFDVIKFQTRTTGKQPNIELMLWSNDMLVYGIRDYQSNADVPAVTLSDYKHVLILPQDARVVMRRDRDFRFSGCVMAGMYEFFAKDCLFNYGTFSIEMNKVDSLRFYARFDGKVYPVEGTLEQLSGELKIDESDNKSSVRETPEYPKFNCPGNAYKFFRTTNGGNFNLELPEDTITEESLDGKFYYLVEPFAVNSLDNLNSEDVIFKGKLVSGGIFPDITETLVVMDDHSLGFDHTIGDGNGDSYPAYGGKGRFHQKIHLANDGFYGLGKLDVESAEFVSENFNFYLDSVVAEVQSFQMHERGGEASLPKASCGPLDIKWDVTVPVLYATTKEEPICIYDNTFFTGMTSLSEQGFGGDGVLTSGLTRFDSKYFDFDSRSFVADSSDFVLYDQDGTTRAFIAENYRSHVNMASHVVTYEYLDEDSHLDFPLNMFYCSLNQAELDMVANNIHLHGGPSEFVSLLPEHDSLSFVSTNADYDMNDYVVHAHGVEHINVADVEISPWDGTVEIQRNADLKPLEHATIVADTAFKAHVYKDAAVSIYSRHDYSALGIKDYIDSEGVATPIFFDNIAPVDSVTVAHAEVPDSLGFMLSPYFGFKGEITSKASDPIDHFDGFFRLERSCLEDTVWFAASGKIDPSAVSIPVDLDQVRKVRQGLFNGLCYEFGSEGGYHVNFMKPINPETMAVTPQNGAMSFDEERNRYVVRDEKSTLTLDNRCVSTMSGVSDLGFDLGMTELACYGDFVNYPNDSLFFEGLNVFSVPVFDDQALHDIAEIYASAEGNAIDLTKTRYLDYVRSEQGEELADALKTEMELTPYPEIEKDGFYDKTIVIPSLKMVWNDELRAFVSEGKIGLGSLGGHVVNRFVDGCVVLDRRLGVITYYFQNDLFMTYISYNCGDGQLQVHATFGTVNARISDIRERNRKAKSGNATFEYVVTPYEAMTGFLSRLKRAGVR